jgi:hypothetical protein
MTLHLAPEPRHIYAVCSGVKAISGQTSRNVFDKMRILRRLQCICVGESVDELTFTEMIVSDIPAACMHLTFQQNATISVPEHMGFDKLTVHVPQPCQRGSRSIEEHNCCDSARKEL